MNCCNNYKMDCFDKNLDDLLMLNYFVKHII